MLLCLGGALSYGFSGLWGRRKFNGVPPITSSICQLICSTRGHGDDRRRDRPALDSADARAGCLGRVVRASGVSTSLGYIVFFMILARAGATNVMLVTLLIPVTAILLGVLILGEPLTSMKSPARW